MKTNYLFPHHLKGISGVLFLLSFLALIVYTALNNPEEPFFNLPVFAIVGNDGFFGDPKLFTIMHNPVLDEIIVLLVIASGIVFAFSKEKNEDEMVAAIRLHSLAWATITNYVILFACYLFIYGLPFLNILMGAMFSQLVIFIVLFRYRIYQFYNPGQNEE